MPKPATLVYEAGVLAKPVSYTTNTDLPKPASLANTNLSALNIMILMTQSNKSKTVGLVQNKFLYL